MYPNRISTKKIVYAFGVMELANNDETSDCVIMEGVTYWMTEKFSAGRRMEVFKINRKA